ncbi:hypothetical protein OI72_19690 [Aeromonas hydrophila]|nr:hypothetical protein OI72_19690 [Aeromonas hydrophila]
MPLKMGGLPSDNCILLSFQQVGTNTSYTKFLHYQTWIATWNTNQGRMMEGQTSYSMFKKGLKLIPKEVRSKVA